MKTKTLIVLAISLMIFACKKEDNDVEMSESKCDATAMVEPVQYDNANDSILTIMNVLVIDDCMHIEYGSSGCDGDTWVLDLYDSGEITENFPSQRERNIRVSLYNQEACLAVFKKQTSFDLTDLRVEGVNEIVLNLESNNTEYLYSY